MHLTRRGITGLLLAVILVSSCAAADPERASDLAAADGTWLVTSYSGPLGSLDAGLDSPVIVDLNTSIMALEGTAGCGNFLGSFTIGRPGQADYAGFSIPGASESDCGNDARQIHDSVIAALEGTTSFRFEEGRLVLAGPETAAVLEPAT